MKQSEFDDFVDVMQLVSEQYGKKPSDGLISLYWQGLKGYEFNAVREAIGKHLANTDTGMFMPKIADIIRMMQGTSLDSALSAWAKVDKAIRRVGPYESVVFDDAIIHKVLHDMGGWLSLGTKTDDEWPFVAKEFENRYRGFKSRNEQIEYPAKLIGLYEAHNAEKNKRVAPPMLIGDQTKAMEVLRLGSSGGALLGFSRMNDVPLVKELENKL
ncbi:MAG: DUF6475 domain-containing protein [Candidatus Paceibacterota bacterium]